MKQGHTSWAYAWLLAGLLALGPGTGRAQTVLVGASRTYPTLRAAVNAGAVVSGATVRIDDGTYADVCIIRGLANVTITSASGRAGGVVFDNAGLGNLALGGKAIIVVSNSPGFAAVGLWFKNAGLGGSAGVAQQGLGAGNQAGLRFEDLTSAGTARVSYCAFDGCVTGIFAAPNANQSLVIDHCDFGYERPNGQAQDGYSHDAYLGEIRALTCVDNHWYGDPYANNCKTRAATNTISGGYNANSNGRCVELPSCGNYAITGGIYVGAGRGQQPFAYGAENQNNGTFSGTISGITLRIGVTNATIWNNAAGTIMAFSGTTQEWYGTGTIPLILRGPGAITGLATSGPARAPALPAAPGPVSGIGGGPLAAAVGAPASAGFAVYPTRLGRGAPLRYTLPGAAPAAGAALELEVWALTGQRLGVHRLGAGATGAVDLPALPVGGYLACLRLSDGRRLTARFGVE
ncbi:hypothetical protein [Hymenobacter sp.]|uniref:hypothetical protein n=1 Tax=Hymenobacter sp. TaxID=1898978 RepID=UPI00286C31E0|nr:hypothetical protein [Hymenobacter sp.]